MYTLIDLISCKNILTHFRIVVTLRDVCNSSTVYGRIIIIIFILHDIIFIRYPKMTKGFVITKVR